MRVRDTLLLVDHKKANRTFLRNLFEDTYNILEADTVEQGMLLLEQNRSCIAAVLPDATLLSDSGHSMLSEISRTDLKVNIPVVAIVSQGDDASEVLAFDLGADDVIFCPFRAVTVQRRLRTVVEFYQQKRNLEFLVEEQAEAIRLSNESMVDSLCSIIETRSAESGLHILRIRQFTRILLEEISVACSEYNLDERTIQIITSAASLHDVGKIGIPDAILNKPDRLTADEYEIMKGHTLIGCQMLEHLDGLGSDEYMRYAHNICHYHHERWDGNGYPEGLTGDAIPICAQAVGLVDVYDALTSDRIYKPAYSHERASNMILNGECGQFSPKLLECFKRVQNSFADLTRTYANGLSPASESITIPLPLPNQKDLTLNSLQAAQAKLRTLLHYLDATVAEVDLNTGVYHILYNPNPEFAALHTAGSFEEALDNLAQNALHPDDHHLVTGELKTYLDHFFTSDLRRRSRHYRVRSTISDTYRDYEATTLRIDMGDPDRREVLALWRPTDSLVPLSDSSALGQTALHGLLGVICCLKDRWFTLEYAGGSFLAMLGYTQHDIDSRFNGRLMELIHPEDRERIVAEMAGQLQNAPFIQNEFRMLRKDGNSIWVLAKGRIATADNGSERLYGVLHDITHIQEEQVRLRRELDHHQIIMEQTNDIIFEVNLEKDTLLCSPKWEARFGYSPISQNLSTQLLRASHFHPEDLPQITEQLTNIRCGADYREVEARIANASGRYLWNRIRASVQKDSQGTPVRLVGVIIDIDSQKRTAQTLQARAEQDSLTKLLNKESSRQKVEAYLSECAPGTQGAMVVIDLDHFKDVNDRYGHLFGDVVLTRAAEELQGLFRESDVLARIGGDEFLVFMKNIPNKALVELRCQRLLDIFRSIYPEQLAVCNFSCSIGVSFFPEQGTTYQALFQQADLALYQSKGLGRNSYMFYTTDMGSIPSHTAISKRIDSNEEPGLAGETFISYIFQHLYRSGDVEDTIQTVLATLGTSMNVSRVYIFENSSDNKTCSNTFEWCNTGISPEIDLLQNISYETDIPGYEQVFDERGVFYCPDIKQLPSHIREILEPQNIRSMLQCAIMDNGVFRGYVGFDECTANRLWTQEQIDLLTSLAQVISLFLLKKRTQDTVTVLAQDLMDALDKQPSWLYVIDPDTCQLLFLNEKTRKSVPEARVGMRCYETFMGCEARCSFCPALGLKSGDIPTSCVIQNSNFGVKIHSEAAGIHWSGKEACLISCREIPAESPK